VHRRGVHAARVLALAPKRARIRRAYGRALHFAVNCIGTGLQQAPVRRQRLDGVQRQTRSGRAARSLPRRQPELGRLDDFAKPHTAGQRKAWPNSCRKVLRRGGRTSAWSGLVGARCKRDLPTARASTHIDRHRIAVHDDVVGQGEKGEEGIVHGRRPPVLIDGDVDVRKKGIGGRRFVWRLVGRFGACVASGMVWLLLGSLVRRLLRDRPREPSTR
jgi:hypothetical protein